MLSESRFKQIYSGLSSIAKKVYEAVPIGSSWHTDQIASEIIRQGKSVDIHVLSGCLNTLIDAGLVQETERRRFVRCPIRVKAVQQALDDAHQEAGQINHHHEEKVLSVPPKAMGQQQAGAINRLGAIAAQASTLAGQLKKLASDIEVAALELADEMAATDAKAERLTQLQALLKELA